MLNTGQDKINAAELLRSLKVGGLYRITVHNRRGSGMARFGKVVRVVEFDSADGTPSAFVMFDQFTVIDGDSFSSPGSMVPLFNGRRFFVQAITLRDEPITLDTWARATVEARVNASTKRAQRAHRAWQRRQSR